jgi:hypothetical protein
VLNGSYLYTIYEAEKSDIITNYSSTFVYEGVAWYAKQSAGTGWNPLYRFRNRFNGTYLFSAYESEKDAIVANYSAVFQLEGVAYYVRQDVQNFALVPSANGGYYDKTECVKDNVTGLIWQGQTAAGIGLRANDKLFTNYDSTSSLQKFKKVDNWGVYIYEAPLQADIDATTNAIGFKNAINAINLCGSSAWRIPKKEELAGIVKTVEYPMIDSVWFPNMSDRIGYPKSFWTSSPYTDLGTNGAWGVSFHFGAAYGAIYRDYVGNGNLQVRLVH